MQIKLVKATSIQPGDKILYRGRPVLVLRKTQTPYVEHFYFETFNDLIFTRTDMNLLKIITGGELA